MGDNTYNNGDDLELNCSSEGGPDLEYRWSRMMNDFSMDTITNTNTLMINGVITVDGGDYTCAVNNTAGTDTRTITVYGEIIWIKCIEKDYMLCTRTPVVDLLFVSVCLWYSSVIWEAPSCIPQAFQNLNKLDEEF